MHTKLPGLALSLVIALASHAAAAQSASTSWTDGTDAVTVESTGAYPSTPLASGPQIFTAVASGAAGEMSATTMDAQHVSTITLHPNGNSAVIATRQGSASVSYENAGTAIHSTLIAGDGFVFTGNYDQSTSSIVSGISSTAGGNILYGPTAAAGIANVGLLSTDTLQTAGQATVGGNLNVSGVTSTNGINNNGQVISGVANGVAATDAANVGQVDAAIQNAVAPVVAAQSATNARVQGQLEDNRKVSSTGTAIALAAAAIPALEQGKSFGMGLGGGTYDGRSAFAVGIASRVNQALQLKFNLGTGSGGKVGAGAGAMWSW